MSRGPGDADLFWGRTAPGSTRELGAETLPEARYLDPDSSTLLGVSAATPSTQPRREASPSPTADAAQRAAQGAAWRRRLSPRHRRAVRTFFSDE